MLAELHTHVSAATVSAAATVRAACVSGLCVRAPPRRALLLLGVAHLHASAPPPSAGETGVPPRARRCAARACLQEVGIPRGVMAADRATLTRRGAL